MGRRRKTDEEILRAIEKKRARDRERAAEKRTDASKSGRRPGAPRNEKRDLFYFMLWIIHNGGQPIKDQAGKLGVKANTLTKTMRRAVKALKGKVTQSNRTK
jgi:hypothetical protein